MQWQPIETAPRGNWIIVTNGHSAEPACWVDQADDHGHVGWCGAGTSYGGILYELHYELGFEPKHWMPLPSPPTPEAGGSV